MMLVGERWRRKGVGRSLMGRALEHFEAEGVTTIRLDATPAGRPLYTSFGFVPDFEIRRYVVSLLVILPVGVLMGLPFPLAMQSLLDHPSQRAYAWAVNGCASVLSSIAAAQLAISMGIPSIAFFAIASYLVAVGAAKKMV